MYTWAVSGTGSYDVYYKISPAPSFAFKHNANGLSSSASKTWTLFPNPSTNELTIGNDGPSPLTTYAIVDMTGRQVLQGALNTGNTSINTAQLAAGPYIIKVAGANDFIGEKIFVKN